MLVIFALLRLCFVSLCLFLLVYVFIFVRLLIFYMLVLHFTSLT